MNTPKILIVDDEPFNIDYLEQELEDLEYETLSAADGQEALDRVQAASPDLILLDIMMPVMDGFQVLASLKADPVNRDIPVIIISANNNMESVIKGIQLGAEDYLPKPFEPTLLQARISSSLEKKRLRDVQKLYLKSLEREMEIGREIQQGFLPSQLPQVPGWDIAAYFKAAREVAGDFYDAFLLSDGNLVCVIGDVCGKGVGAALFMTLFRSLIRATSTTDDFLNRKEQASITPAERLHHAITFTDHYLTTTHADANMFATIFIGIFDFQSGQLTYINGGNEPPLLLRQGCPPLALLPTGPVVGIIPGASYSIREITMEPGSLLLAFTDGVTDANNIDDETFGSERLLDLLGHPEVSSTELLKNIEANLSKFIGAQDQFDDITMVGIKRNP